MLEEGVVQRQQHRHTSGLLACLVLFNAWNWFVVCRCMAVLLETSLGDLVIDLYCDNAPKGVPCMYVNVGGSVHMCCAAECINFLKLCKVKYYNYCLVHRVQVT